MVIPGPKIVRWGCQSWGQAEGCIRAPLGDAAGGCRGLGLGRWVLGWGRRDLLAGGGQQAATGRAAQISIPDRPAGEIYRTGDLKRPCTQEKESPVNRLSVILFDAVPILPAPALQGCGTGVSSCPPPAAGEPQCRAQMGQCRQQCRQEGAAGLGATWGNVPHAVPHPRMVTLRQAAPPSPGTGGEHQIVPWPHSQWDGLSQGGPLHQTP